VELGVVIGQRCKRVPEEKAMDVVVGYCIALDLTARDLQTAAKDKGLPWSVPKGYDHFTPVGQFIDKTAIPDPHNLELFCEVNGVQRQRGSTGEMIFKLPKLILICELAESACVCLLVRVPCFRLVERETKKRTPMGSSYLDTHTCTFLIWINVLQVQA
ncbi:unnamed protein product, partial [Effrenium voratum]